MLALISSFFRTIIIIDIYKHITILKSRHNKNSYLNYLLPIVLFLISSLVHFSFPELLPIISIPLFTLYAFLMYNNKLKVSLAITFISYTIYYVSFNIISLLATLLYILFHLFDYEIPSIALSFISELLTYFTIHSLFRIRRIRSQISIITNTKFLYWGILISLIIFVIKTVDSLCINSSKNIETLPFTIILLAFLLFTWWRKQITKSYIEKLRKLEVQSLYDELEEKERQIQKLASDNESLARIVHKDNKLIPAMEHAVTSFLSSDNFHDPIKASQYGMELTQKLRNIAMERQGTLDTYDNENHKLRLTGHVSLDAILVYMKKKADANHISFECRHSPETLDYLFTKITEDDLTHLLSDLMENAIIAMRGLEDGRLQITFGKFQKEAYISIADNGIPFDIATLHSFGLQAHTTHTDSGGSGIGLMDIWKIKRKYRATIQIQEYENLSNSFSKRVLFSFNSKNHYVIQSFRHEEIRNTQTRGDLYLIPAEAKEKNEGKQHERNTETLNS